MRVWNVIRRPRTTLHQEAARDALARGLRRDREHRDYWIHMASAAAAGCPRAAAWMRLKGSFDDLCIALRDESRLCAAAAAAAAA